MLRGETRTFVLTFLLLHSVTSQGHYLTSSVSLPNGNTHYDSNLPLQHALTLAASNLAHLISKLDSDYIIRTKYSQLDSDYRNSNTFFLPADKLNAVVSWGDRPKKEPQAVVNDYTISANSMQSHDSLVRNDITEPLSATSSLTKRAHTNPLWRYRLRRYRAFRTNKLFNVWTPRFQSDSYLFGDDDRSVVDTNALRKYPYNNIVRLSTGCTGTMVSPRHVLTAAHCVHNGKESKVLNSVKVDVPGVMGSRIYFAVKAMIPTSWMTGATRTERAMNDFAILTLSSAVPGQWHFLQPDWTTDPLDRVIKFYAYPADHHPDLWSSTCFIDGRTGSLLLNRCDASSGTSGASALMRVKSHGMRIIGVVSAVIENPNPGKHFNAITRLTLDKLHVICDMISYPYNRYFCSDLPPSNIDARSRYIVEYFL